MRQFATVVRDTDNVAAIVAFAAPSAAISKALARTTSRCAPDCDRANDFNTSRCPSVTVNAGTGLLMPESYQLTANYLRDTPLDTSRRIAWDWLIVDALGKDGDAVSVQFVENDLPSYDGQSKCLTAAADFGAFADGPVQVGRGEFESLSDSSGMSETVRFLPGV